MNIFDLPLTFLSDLAKILNTIDCLNLINVLENRITKKSAPVSLKRTNYFQLLINLRKFDVSNSKNLKSQDFTSLIKLFEPDRVESLNCSDCVTLNWQSIGDYVLKLVNINELNVLSVFLTYSDIDLINEALDKLEKFHFKYPQKEYAKSFTIKNKSVHQLTTDISSYLDDPTPEIVDTFVNLKKLILVKNCRSFVKRFASRLGDSVKQLLVFNESLLFSSSSLQTLLNSLEKYFICGQLDKLILEEKSQNFVYLNLNLIKLNTLYTMAYERATDINDLLTRLNASKLKYLKIKSSSQLTKCIDAMQFDQLFSLDLRSTHVHTSVSKFCESLGKMVHLQELHLPCCALHLFDETQTEEISFKRSFEDDDDYDTQLKQVDKIQEKQLDFIAHLSINKFGLHGLPQMVNPKDFSKCVQVDYAELACLSKWKNLIKVEFTKFKIICDANRFKNAMEIIRETCVNDVKIEEIKNLLSYDCQKFLMDTLKNNLNIRNLYLDNKYAQITQALIDAISSMHYLKYLYIATAQSFPKKIDLSSLITLETLKSLTISCQITTYEAQKLTNYLKKLLPATHEIQVINQEESEKLRRVDPRDLPRMKISNLSVDDLKLYQNYL